MFSVNAYRRNTEKECTDNVLGEHLSGGEILKRSVHNVFGQCLLAKL